MIDQVYDREGMDVPLEVAMINALGYVNGTKVTKEIVEKNPGWTKDTTRFEIWDAITKTAAAKNIFVHPDVHIHKAQWCCSSAGECLENQLLSSHPLTRLHRWQLMVRRHPVRH